MGPDALRIGFQICDSVFIFAIRFRVGISFQILGIGFQIWGIGFQIWGIGFQIWGSVFKAWDSVSIFSGIDSKLSGRDSGVGNLEHMEIEAGLSG